MPTETILIELAKTVKAIGFYPEGHPNLEAVIAKTFNLIIDAIKENGQIKLRVDRTVFMDGKLIIGKGLKQIEALAEYLFLRRIKEINFTQDATLNEFKSLLLILKMDIDSLKKVGGFHKLLITNEIKGIQFNEMNYEDLRKRVIELEETKRKQDEEAKGKQDAEAKEGEAITEVKIEEEEVMQNLDEHIKDVLKKEATLEDLLVKLEKEADTLIYKTIVEKIMEKIKPLQEGKDLEGLFPVIILFAAHGNPESLRNWEQKNIASENLKIMIDSGMIDFLIIKLCSRNDESRRKEIQHILIFSGEPAMKKILAALVDREDAYSRRQIFNVLTMFGEMVMIEAEKCLDDERWFVVRQMVSLLGEIGSHKSLKAIISAYGHKDIRVKKEVLKAVAKIPSGDSTSFLLEKLMDNNTSLKLQAIISLGILKDMAAVEHLGNIAQKRYFFSENIELNKEAVRSLGIIGGSNAISILKNLLKREVFWGKKQNDEVKSVAAIFFGKLAGKDAVDLLEEVAKSSKGIVHNACKKAIEGIK